MTFERHQDVSQTDHLSTKTHRPQTIHPVCAAFQVIDLIAICSTHGLIFPVTLSNFSAMGLSSIVQTVQNQAPRHKYEDRRLEITWFARRITIYKPFFKYKEGFNYQFIYKWSEFQANYVWLSEGTPTFRKLGHLPRKEPTTPRRRQQCWRLSFWWFIGVVSISDNWNQKPQYSMGSTKGKL